jgi:hypothetical protein
VAVAFAHIAAGRQHQVDLRHLRAAHAETLARDALDQVAIMRIRQMLLADRETDARLRRHASSDDANEKAAALSPAALEHTIELARQQQPGTPRKARTRHCPRITGSGDDGPWRDDDSAQRGHSWWPCGRGSHGCEHA